MKEAKQRKREIKNQQKKQLQAKNKKKQKHNQISKKTSEWKRTAEDEPKSQLKSLKFKQKFSQNEDDSDDGKKSYSNLYKSI